jgi:ABC-type multidrug transport system fused ATPase/permease subunit
LPSWRSTFWATGYATSSILGSERVRFDGERHRGAGLSGNPGITLLVRGLCVSFRNGGERVTALEGVRFDLRPGQVLAPVDESGSGKSLTALTVMGPGPSAVSAP